MELFSIKDLIDILLFASILYGVFYLLRRSGAVNLFWGIFAFVLLWFATRYIFELKLTGALFNRVVSVGAIAVIVIFQNEIRAFFYNIGIHVGRLTSRFRHGVYMPTHSTIERISTACANMSKTKTGALIILEGRQDLTEYADTGERLDAIVSVRLIEHIFFKNTPLHDGALIVRQTRLLSAACVMPLSSDRNLPKQYGLRHRAALGIAEHTDAVAVVVSEETGRIAVAHGNIMEEVGIKELQGKLSELWEMGKDIKNENK